MDHDLNLDSLIKTHVRVVEDYPKPGVSFFDFTPILNNPKVSYEVFKGLLKYSNKLKPDVIVGVESRGFYYSHALSLYLSIPFVPARKAGKLPFYTHSSSYDLEYGFDTIEIHKDAITPDSHIMIIDDVLATGGTAKATVNLMNHFSPSKVSLSFILSLPHLGGEETIKEMDFHSLCKISVVE